MKSPQNTMRTALLFIALVSSILPSGLAQQRTRRRPATSRQATTSEKKAATTKAAPRAESGAVSTATNRPARATDSPAEVELKFDELVSSDSFAIYGEVRSLSQFVRSENVAEIIGTLGKIGGGLPIEMNQFLQFVGENSEALAHATVTFAGLPTRRDLPDALSAIRLPTVEEARRFEPQLKKYLSNLPAWMTTQTPPAGAASHKPSAKSTTKRAAAPARFIIKRHGNLLLASEKPFDLRNLKSENAAPLTNDVRFQQARTRLASDQFFLYVNVNLLSQSTKLLGEQREEQMRAASKAGNNSGQQRPQTSRADVTVTSSSSSEASAAIPSDPALFPADEKSARLVNIEASEAEKDAELEAKVVLEALDKEKESGVAQAEDAPAGSGGVEAKAEVDALGTLWPLFFGRMFSGGPQWPEAVGVGVDLNERDFLVRILLIEEAGKQSPLIPFLPIVTRGPATVTEAASIAPADTELFVGLSLDVPRMYEQIVEGMSEAQSGVVRQRTGGQAASANDKTPTVAARIAAIEEKHKFRIKDDFLATIGNEVAISTSLSYFGLTLMGGSRASREKSAADFVAFVALRDKDAFKKMLPRVAEALGMKLLLDLAKTEKQDDVEIVTVAGFAYAYVNNFLVFSTSSAAVRRAAENYTSGNTLAAKESFRDPTAWQPREKVAQVFVASSMMEELIASAKKQLAQGDPDDRNTLATLPLQPAAITYAVSEDGGGLMHELHLPANLMKLMAVMATVEMKQAPIKSKESTAMYALMRIIAIQNDYKKGPGAGSYAATLDDLRQAGLLKEDFLKTQDYKIEMTASGTKLEVTATPVQYGVSGRRSFFIDENGTLRGADHGGERATVADEEVN